MDATYAVYVCVYMHIQTSLYMYLCMYVHMCVIENVCKIKCVSIHIYMHACVCAVARCHVQSPVGVPMAYLCICRCMYVCVCACVYYVTRVSMCVRVCMYVCIEICMCYVCVHEHVTALCAS